MKILQINDTYRNLGGAERYLLGTCNALEEMGHQIVIISSAEKDHISVRGRKEYFVPPSYGARSTLKTWGIYSEIVERENPDIIHLHQAHYFVSPVIIRRLCQLKPMVKFVHDVRFFCPLGTKVIPSANALCYAPVGIQCFQQKGCYPFCGEHGSVFANMHKFLLVSYELRVSRMLDTIIVGSHYMHDELVRNGFAADKITILPCYTDLVMGCTETPQEKGLILFVGRLFKEKGVPQFMEALRFLKNAQWHAEIVGEGDFRKEAEELAKQSGLEQRITFRGQLSEEEVARCYKRCSMVVLPSMMPESFGLVGIEAMSWGKPVVAFDTGGIREWLVDHKTGFLVERGDTKGLAEKISLLLDDESLAKEMGERGKERVKHAYSKEAHITKLLIIYEEAINRRIRTKTNPLS